MSNTTWQGIDMEVQCIVDELQDAIDRIRETKVLADRLADEGVPEPSSFHFEPNEDHRLEWGNEDGSGRWLRLTHTEAAVVLSWSTNGVYGDGGAVFEDEQIEAIAAKIKEMLHMIEW